MKEIVVTIQVRERTAVSRRRLNACTGHGTDQLIGGVRQSLRVTAANKPAAVRCCSCDVSWAAGSREKDRREKGQKRTTKYVNER